MAPADRLGPDEEPRVLMKFALRPPQKAAQDQARIKTLLRKLSEEIDFRLVCASADYLTGLSLEVGSNTRGNTTPDPAHGRTTIQISFDILEPLLPDNINRMTVADQRLIQIVVGTTLVHGLCVSTP